jgi:protein tyrosine phosphatase (PTP) superfamily phosphohydrolase (DUF442 family)
MPGEVAHVWNPVRRHAAKAIAVAALAGLTLLAAEAGRVLLGPNMHEVVPNRVYRCAQLEPEHLRSVLKRFGIRTVINLRGCCPAEPWYQQEQQVVRELGLNHYDINFSSYLTPAVPELQKLVQLLDDAPQPVLLHCRRGADRTSLAAMTAALLDPNSTLADAKGQLSWRYGHVPLGRVAAMGEVFGSYRDWLAGRGEPHQPDLFRQWVRDEYRPGHCWAQIEPLQVPDHLGLGRPAAAKFRVHNRSRLPWQFRQAAHVGVHLRCFLLHENGSYGVLSAAGFFDQQVGPGGSIDLTVPLPALTKPGKYSLLVDMSDEQSCWFFMVGSPPYRHTVEVKDDVKLVHSR